MGTAAGIMLPPLKRIAEYHPQFALAVRRGALVRPDSRVQSVTFQDSTAGKEIDSTWDDKITSWSLFCGTETTLDPTSQFAGNPLKTMSDKFQAMVTGITFRFTVQASKSIYYAPASSLIPLQTVDGTFGRMAGIWSFREPENIKAQFISNVAAPAVPLTCWIVWGFAVLQMPDGLCDCLEMTYADARAELLALECWEKKRCDDIMAKLEAKMQADYAAGKK